MSAKILVGNNVSLLAALERLGEQACGYFTPGRSWLESTCDCKYGGPKPQGEQTGCPELRSAHRLLSMLTEGEWREIAARTWMAAASPDAGTEDDDGD